MELLKYRISKTIVIVTSLLATVAGLVAFVDPFFHYHHNLSCFKYPLVNPFISDSAYFERYCNHGMVRNLRYNALVTGTSMAENFRTSELDSLFGVHSIKVCFSGASCREINDNLKIAIESNPDIHLVVRSLDASSLFEAAKYTRRNDEKYASYLYNDNPFDDINYLLNKDAVIFALFCIVNTIKDGSNMDFDIYSNWMKQFPNFGVKQVKKTYKRIKRSEEGIPQDVSFWAYSDLMKSYLYVRQPSLKEKWNNKKRQLEMDYRAIRDNLEANIISIARENPDIEFYYFFPPYSIYWWDQVYCEGEIVRRIESIRLATEILNEMPNVHVFGFWDYTSIICNLDNYKDYIHYGDWVNSFILQAMKSGENELTKYNREKYFDSMYQFYSSYDYDSLF